MGLLGGAFQHFVSEGRLTGFIFYDWSDKPGNEGGIFRCGALTDAGKLALKPSALPPKTLEPEGPK
jgi:hypothetical protein